MRIAHLSDLHLLALEGVPAHRFLNKRATGWVNLRLKRGSVHRRSYVEVIAREIARSEFDHVVITGDLTNLALESEFQVARDLLERDLGLPPDRVTIVPGNHDVYTRGAMRSRRFERYFAPWLAGDLPDLAVDVGGVRFPIVKLRGPAAVVALSSAVPRPPFVAAGELGEAQVRSLARILDHPEVRRRTPVLVLHHPPAHPWSRLKEHLEGLRDAEALLSVLGHLPHGLVLHGHLHRRIQRPVLTRTGELRQVGATSASLQHEEPDRMAGFNVYELSDRGLETVEAVVYEPGSGVFRTASVPESVRPLSVPATGRGPVS
jgi:3',5'-cyclic AMP phosphodiesterase CpdA